MDNLISHLEQSLDEEECIKEALLLLSGLESSSNFCDQSSSSQSTSNTTPQQRTSPPDINHTDQTVLKPKIFIDSQAKTLISLFVSQSSHFGSLRKKNELPIKIVAFRINVPDFLLQDVCFCDDQSLWPSNFLDSCLKVLECFEKCKEERIVTQDSTSKAASLKAELAQLKLSGSAEAALAFIQENAAEYLNHRATPMRLGGRRSDQFMNTQEIPLQDRREQVREEQQEQQEVSGEQRDAAATATAPIATGADATAAVETETFQSSSSRGSSGNSHSTGGGNLQAVAAPTASRLDDSSESVNGSTTFSKLSALSGGSVSGSSSGSGGTATSAVALNKTPITKKIYSSSCNNANNSAAKSSPPALYKLAPLVEHQRCPKHFIIPLMEPDLMYNFQGTFAPSHRSITLGDMTRPMTAATVASNKPKTNKSKVKKQRFSL